MGLLVFPNKMLQFFQTKDYKIQKILKDINFIFHLSYLSDILEAMNHCMCYLQGPESKIVNFAIKLTTSGEGKVQLASHKRLFDPREVALQLFVRNTEDLFLFCNCTYTPQHFQLLRDRRLFLIFLPPFACSVGLTFFFSLTRRWQHFGCSTFPQVALSMKASPTLRLPSSESSIHDNDSHNVRLLQSLKLCCPDVKPQCYLL